jgi:uncharacterized protein DUF3175
VRWALVQSRRKSIASLGKTTGTATGIGSNVTRMRKGNKMNSGSPQIPVGLFAKTPDIIAESLASRETFPDGPATGMRMLTFYISYAGRHLSASRMRGLERAKKLLAARMERMLKEERQPAA